MMLVLALTFSSLFARPVPTPAPEPVVTPHPDMKLEWCRELVGSIPQLCAASREEMGSCWVLRDSICPAKD